MYQSLILIFFALLGFTFYKQWSFNRWIRRLDAEERIGVARMRQEWHENETKRMLEEFSNPLIFHRPEGKPKKGVAKYKGT